MAESHPHGRVHRVAFAVVMVPSARRAWNSLAVTVAGKVLYMILVLWGVYGLIADCVSIANDQPSHLPFNP